MYWPRTPGPGADTGPRARLADRPSQAREAATFDPPADSLIRILERARKAKPDELSRSTVHRSIIEHAGDLWVGDVKHGPKVIYKGRRRKSYSINIIDCATRFVVASRICLSESAVAHEGVLKGVIERWQQTWGAEFLEELPDMPLELADLQSKH